MEATLRRHPNLFSSFSGFREREREYPKDILVKIILMSQDHDNLNLNVSPSLEIMSLCMYEYLIAKTYRLDSHDAQEWFCCEPEKQSLKNSQDCSDHEC